MIKKLSLFFTLILILSLDSCNSIPLSPSEEGTSSSLENWLSKAIDEREDLANLDFAQKALSKAEAEAALNLLVKDHKDQIISQYAAQWDNSVLQLDGKQMPFFYQTFGEAPASGRSLFISMHGGGGAPASVNDQQYRNQQRLYDATMAGLEGIYLAPRAPSNTWDLWHQSHIDDFFNLLIQLAVIKENVDPNKVYLMGYSAGGDGVFQLSPRMADRWAAAAMSAGHPNETSPLGLKNIAFALHMGAEDAAYNRNQKAAEWKVFLGNLAAQNPGTYIHDVQIHEGLGHWMELKDAVALPWMKNYSRNPIPESVVWKQDDVHHPSFYWLSVPEQLVETGAEIRASYNTGLKEINIESNYSDTLVIHLNDHMFDLDDKIKIKYQGNLIAEQHFDRTILNLYKSLQQKGDRDLSFSVSIKVIGNERVEE